MSRWGRTLACAASVWLAVGCSSSPGKANTAPVASAVASVDASPMQLLKLDGSASTDADGDALTYSWRQTSGTAVGALEPIAQPQFQAPEGVSTLVFELVVRDAKGAVSAPATVQVNVLADPTRAVFVATAGDDAADGSRATPLKTIQAGIAKAATLGVGAGVYVGEGLYEEAPALESNVAIYGGYGPGWLRAPAVTPTHVKGGTTAVRVDTKFGIVLDGLTIESAAGAAPGESSTAVLLSAATGVTLRDCTLIAGAGAPGTAGAAGAAGANGGDGFPGAAGVGQCSAWPAGGAGGSPYPGGGAGGSSRCGNGSGYPGLSGSLAVGNGGAAGGTGGVGADGGAGPNGLDGGAGAAGAAFGGVGPAGYRPAPGFAGFAGAPGAGGGGGGGGGGYTISLLFVFNYSGGGGGGGGSGGQGGAGGEGGGGGGGSFGVVMNGSTGIVLSNLFITTANGGDGGAGAPGGAGGAGGAGALGGATVYPGGKGGAGGTGGLGGGGSGGGGGPSVAVAEDATSTSTRSGIVATLGAGGVGGAGGVADNAGAAGEVVEYKKL